MITKKRVDEILSQERTNKDWNKLLDSAKVADYESMDLKDYFIKAIGIKLHGADYKNQMLLREIEECSADIEDIN